ncbi:hypothetical protein [Kitasatospora sp. NPDC057223]|uniref:hypothetical protein n=1 Tax=Kitasatospora sp. NPDC057223 TaxID=3346055 RepID=UPI00362FBE50
MSNGAGIGQGADGTSAQQSGGPAIGPVQPVVSPYLSPPVAAEPDWAALADDNEREARRRKRVRVIGAAVAATVVVGAITATAVSVAGGGRDTPGAAAVAGPSPAAGTQGFVSGPDTPPPAAPADASATAATGATGTAPASPSASAAPSPGRTSAKPGASASPARSSAGTPAGAPATAAQPPAAATTAAPPAPAPPAPRDPLTLISDLSTDTAPLDPGTLFAATSVNVGGRTWTRVVTDSNPTCWQTTTGGLGDVISAQSCRLVVRATYASGNSAVTVGVAVFDHKAQADAAQQAYKGQIQGLAKPGGIHWCISAGCPGTHAVIGRYGYYTVSGTLNPGNNTADAVATAAGPDFAARASAALLARGQAAAG